MDIKEKYKVLALDMRVLREYPSGYIPRMLSKEVICRKLKISRSTYTRLLNICLKNGICEYRGRAIAFVSWQRCLCKLGIDTGDKNIQRHYSKHFRKYYRLQSPQTFMETAVWIRECLLFINLSQQSYKAEKGNIYRDKVLRFANGHQGGKTLAEKICKEARSEGVSFDLYVSKVAKLGKNYVKTGSYHAGSFIGMSHQTGHRSIRNLNSRGLVKSETVRVKLPYGLNNPFISRPSKGIIYPSKKFGAYFHVLGQKVEIKVCPKTLLYM